MLMQWHQNGEKERKIFWVGGKPQKMKSWSSLKEQEVKIRLLAQSHAVYCVASRPWEPWPWSLWSLLPAFFCKWSVQELPATQKLCYSDGGHLTAPHMDSAIVSLLGFYPPNRAVLQCAYQGRVFWKTAAYQVAFLENSETRGLPPSLAWATEADDTWIITCALCRSTNACEKGNLPSLLLLAVKLLMGILKLFVRWRFGEPKVAKDLKQVCWVLASHVDQELKVGGLGKEPVAIGPGDGVILDSNTFILWLSSKGYFCSLFCSSAQASLSFSQICRMMCSTCQVQHRKITANY